MIDHSDDGFRKTGIWLMGETGDLRFLPVLARLMKESTPALRPYVFRAFAKLKQKRSRLSTLPPLRVYALGGKSLAEGWREIHLSPLSASGQTILGLKATQLALWEKQALILEYNLLPVVEKEPLSVAFAMPRNVSPAETSGVNERAMKSCLGLKRKIDGWMILQYCRSDESEEKSTQDESTAELRFILDSAAAEKSFKARKPRQSSARNLLCAVRGLIAAMSRGRGRRHLVFLDDGSGKPPDARSLEEIVSAAKIAEITIHGISQRETAFHDLCAETEGQWLVRSSDDSVPELLTTLYAYLTARYQVRYQSNEVADLGIEICTEQGVGEAAVRV
jgi:hypothetical protein